MLLGSIWRTTRDALAFEDDQDWFQSDCFTLVTKLNLCLVKHATTEKSQAGAGLLLVYASLAAIKVSPTDPGEIRFRKEVAFAPIASALIYCGRMMAMAPSASADRAPLRGDQIWAHVRQFQQDHLSKSRPRPISTLVRWRRWCQAVMSSETGKVSFDFDPASGTLAFDGEEWSLRALRHFATFSLSVVCFPMLEPARCGRSRLALLTDGSTQATA